MCLLINEISPEWFLSSMNPHVHLETLILSEGRFTNVAEKWAEALVVHLVALEISFCGKTFRTGGALKGSFSRMGPHVY